MTAGSAEQAVVEEVAASRRFERSLLWRELVAVAVVVALVVLRQVWGI